MTRPKYKIEVYNKADERLAIIDLPLSLSIDRELNKSSRLDFSIAGTDTKWSTSIINGRNNVKVYRDGTLFWTGQIMLVSIDIKDGIIVHITCLDWFGLLHYRYISKIYTAVDAGDMAWDMINTSQGYASGSLGITEGTIEATTNRDRTFEFEEIGKAIENLTAIENGFDFEINVSKVFNVWAYKGSDKSASVRFKSDYNIDSASLKLDDYQVANAIKVVGDGEIVKNAEDANSLTNYGRREKVLKETGWKDQTTLQEKANEAVSRYKWTSNDLEFKITPHSERPSFTDWDIGDKVSVELYCGAFVYTDTVRIYGYSINVAKDGVEQITLKVDNIYE